MSRKTELEKRLGHQFGDEQLLQRALTHRSYHSANNERLEFLGDALLDLVISEALFQHFPQASEGQLTRARAALVKGDTLAELAREIALGEHLLLGSGELKSGGFRRASILADTLEALFGAIYLDSGLDACRRCILSLYAEHIADNILDVEEKDPKTSLQEWLQARKLNLPVYAVVHEEGDAQEKLFQVKCSVGQRCEPQIGSGDSKRSAEMAAAEKVLALLLQSTQKIK